MCIYFFLKKNSEVWEILLKVMMSYLRFNTRKKHCSIGIKMGCSKKKGGEVVLATVKGMISEGLLLFSR